MKAVLALMPPVDLSALPEYPIDPDFRLDSHGFIQWEFRRWVSSDMRWNGTHECKSMWFELLNLSHSETPVGTLPRDMKRLAKMIQPTVERDHFEALCNMPYGPLHGWTDCRCGEGARLMHPVVTRIVQTAIAFRANHAARVQAAAHAKKLKRLTEDVAQLAPNLVNDPRKIRFISAQIEQLVDGRGGERRTNEDLHIAIQACIQADRQGRFSDKSSS